MKRPYTILVTISGFFLLAASGMSAFTGMTPVNASSTTTMAESNESLAKVVIAIDGMSCGGCVATINEALAKFESIREISVDVANGKAEVLYQADAMTDVEKWADAITKSGYPARIALTVTAEAYRSELLETRNKSTRAIASVGNMEISRTDFEAELAHARSRYETLYGDSVFSSQRGKQLLKSLEIQITRRLIAETVQLNEINQAGFVMDSALLEDRYQEFLDKRGLTSKAFEDELHKNGYSKNYFMRKFRNRIRIDSYLDREVFIGITNENEKQKRYLDWFNNAQLLAEVTYYDKELERNVLSATTKTGGCGNSCSTAR